jgi:hypothetical protein
MADTPTAEQARQALTGHPPRTEYRPCALCGWGPARGIHSIIVSGPRKGEPWGHAYVAARTQQAGKERQG